MILLDTDHLTVLSLRRGERWRRLQERLDASGERPGTTIVNIEEQLRGWLAALAKERRLERQVNAYRELAEVLHRFGGLELALFNEAALGRLVAVRKGRGHLSMMDLKIAAIALANNALLLTANRRDFEQVPSLRFENWLAP